MNEMTWARPMFQVITGYIYFVQMDRIGPIKIGFAKDIGKRLLSLHTGSAYPLRLLCFFPGNETMEEGIHLAFNCFRLEGEWFLPHPRLLRLIDEILKQPGTNKHDPEKHFGDWTLGGNAWERKDVLEYEEKIDLLVEKKIKNQKIPWNDAYRMLMKELGCE